MGFVTIRDFRHPLGYWNVSPMNKGGVATLNVSCPPRKLTMVFSKTLNWRELKITSNCFNVSEGMRKCRPSLKQSKNDAIILG